MTEAIQTAKKWLDRPRTALDLDCCAFYQQYNQAVEHLKEVIKEAEMRPQCLP